MDFICIHPPTICVLFYIGPHGCSECIFTTVMDRYKRRCVMDLKAKDNLVVDQLQDARAVVQEAAQEEVLYLKGRVYNGTRAKSRQS